ncbi:chitobiase/beta-hexosaminidase C-terminal domain-containing protein [Spirosoma endbachense]|nr:chitobiase/beta-hexosaminidase C-terminal domain-containing protein [Spirosoma endbachense]
MTRAKPRSGTFGKTLNVVLLPDARGGDIHYTLDGTDPTLGSRAYTEPSLLDRTLTLKAQTFNNGSPVGFSMQEEYILDKNKSVPSWLKTLLAPEVKSVL